MSDDEFAAAVDAVEVELQSQTDGGPVAFGLSDRFDVLKKHVSPARASGPALAKLLGLEAASIACAGGCGRRAFGQEAMKKWQVLQITSRLRCWECTRALEAVGREPVSTGYCQTDEGSK